MRRVSHPLVEEDLIGIVAHVLDATGEVAHALRREAEAAALIDAIAANPRSGTRLGGRLRGWLVRHGGHGRMLTVVFRVDDAADALLVALVAFGAQDWVGAMDERRGFSG